MPDSIRRNRKRPYKSVFFDFDGVLVESNPIKAAAFESLYGEYGAEVVARVAAHHTANEGISRLIKIRHCHREFLGVDLSDDALAALGVAYSARVEDEVAACDDVPGAREFLKDHHRTLPLFVISGTPEDVDELVTLDPARMNEVVQFQITSNVLSGLTHIDANLVAQPDAAMGWDVSDDGKEFTFHLRKGMTFHNGDPFTAEDVVFT